MAVESLRLQKYKKHKHLTHMLPHVAMTQKNHK